MTDIVLIAHNIRSTHNVGSLFRTADGLGISKLYLTGYTPYPISKNDSRLPHLAVKSYKQIAKTALGAEDSVAWEHCESINDTLAMLKKAGYAIYALEQTANSILLPGFKSPPKLALIVGREVEGIEEEVIAICDGAIEIPMFGKKESYNVSLAAAMAMYHCRFISTND
jgi:23S rRNA (guanosine2251-2'-O)-methyltransferase